MDRKSHGAQAVSSQPMFATAEFLNLEHTAHPKLFENQNYVWDALKQIASYLQFRLKPAILGDLMGKPLISNHVFIGRGTVVEQGAVLKGPAWTGENCHVRTGCYVGDRTEIGCNAVINPGSVIGRDCMIYPSVNFRGVLPPESVVKLRQELQVVEQRDR